ncbi:MAG: ferrous iron transport protein B [Saprospiraceae bacterium]|nr:ferrous iron transport protein B [Saprospiraceae bacterium]
MIEHMKLALIGNPNSGKSSLFNALSGLNQRVGNFPGVTVEAKTAILANPGVSQTMLIDLPGAYSLYPISEDEKVLSSCLTDPSHPLYPDLALYVADISLLDKQLLLLTQLADLGIPLMICLTNSDQVSIEQVSFWVNLLTRQFNVKVIAVSNRNGENLDLLRQMIGENIDSNFTQTSFDKDYYNLALLTQLELPYGPNPFENAKAVFKQAFDPLGSSSSKKRIQLQFQIEDTMRRYAIIDTWLADSKKMNQTDGLTGQGLFTFRLDKLLTHPIIGLFIFLGIILFIFQMIFSFAQWPMDIIDHSFAWLANQLMHWLPANDLTSFLTKGLIPGLAGIMVFIPQIAILFLFMAILEETGYMARVVYLLDHLLSKIGLNGRSVIGLISGGACAIPAILSTRSIKNRRERLLTSFVIPLIPCSARLPVYAALVGFIIPADRIGGIFNLQGLVFTGLYLMGILAALLTAFILHLLLPVRESSLLAMPLPVYQIPQWTQVWVLIKNKVNSFVMEAGKIILMIAIILWFLANYSFPGQMENARKEAQREANRIGLKGEQSSNFVESMVLENSFAGQIGHRIEPLIQPLGFDWKIGIALITSFAAREVFVGTMSTIYSLGPNTEISTLREKMAAETSKDGSPFFTSKRALSLVVFYAFAMQCMSTLAVMKRETGKWSWALGQFLYMGVLAWLASFAVWNFF